MTGKGDFILEHRPLGDTGVMAPVMGFGASPFGDIFGKTDLTDIKNTVAAAIEAGMDYFDVAPSYGPEGRAEERLGIALEGRRHEVFLATKCGKYDHGTAENAKVEYDYSYKRTIREIEESLRRLKTDYVDLYQVHEICNCDFQVLIEETLPAMAELQKQGKIRFIGITDNSLHLLKQAVEASQVKLNTVLNFCCYNLIDTRLDGYFGTLLKDRGIGLISASVLCLGLLTPSNKTLYAFRNDEQTAPLRKAIEKAHALCSEYGESLSDQAVMFAMQYQEPSMTLMGMGRMSSLQRNLKLLGRQPNWELIGKLRALFENVYNPFNRD